MKSKDDSAILEIENPVSIDIGSTETLESVSNASELLQFQDYPRNVESGGGSHALVKGVDNPAFVASVDDGVTPEDEESDVLLGGTTGKQQVHAFWELSYFAQYFDVTTSQVVSRILYSMLPYKLNRSDNYIHRHIQANADFYGPFWINITLIFTIAIFGNISDYLRTEGAADTWHYDFHKLGLAASTVFSYTIVVPIVLWFFFWFRGCVLTYTLFEMICAYGYSISVYIPVSVIWLINMKLVQYFSVIFGALLSGSVLVISFAPVVQSDPSTSFKSSYLILMLIVGLHGLLAFSFLVYFF